MQNRTDEFESEIMHFISMELNNWQPRDKEYAIQHLNTKLSRLTPYITKDPVLEDLYKKYRLGSDIFQILDDEYFYNTLPYDKYPHLFKIGEPTEIPISKVKKKATKAKSKHAFDDPLYECESILMPPEITLIKEQIPIVKKTLTKDIKNYIFFMEFKNWIKKNGITKPELKSAETLSLIKTTNKSRHDEVRECIDKHLLFLKNQKDINTENYNNLVLLLIKYFLKEKTLVLDRPIVVNSGVTRILAYSLGRVYFEVEDSSLNITYLILCKENILVFKKHNFDKTKFQKSNLYKYFTSNPRQ